MGKMHDAWTSLPPSGEPITMEQLDEILDTIYATQERVRLDNGSGKAVMIHGYAPTQFSSLTPQDRGPISRAYLDLKNKT